MLISVISYPSLVVRSSTTKSTLKMEFFRLVQSWISVFFYYFWMSLSLGLAIDILPF